jgi:hypothetical protein
MNGMLLNSVFKTRKAAAHVGSGFNVQNYGGLLQRLGYVTGTDAAGTGLNGLDAAICYGSDLLQVRIPHGTGFVIGVAHVVAEAGAFSTNITFS